MALKRIKGKNHHYYDIQASGKKYEIYRKKFTFPDGRSKTLQVSKKKMDKVNEKEGLNLTLAVYWEREKQTLLRQYEDGITDVKKLDTRVRDLAEKYRLYNENFRQGTYLRKQGYWDRNIFPYFKDYIIRKIEPSTVKNFYDELLLENTPKTVLEVHRVLNNFFQWMIDEKMKIISEVPIAKSTITNLNKTITEQNEKMEALDEDDEKVLSNEDIMAIFYRVREVMPRDEIVYHWNGLHGLRISEALGVYWKDIDWNKKLLRVRRQTAGYSVGKLKGTKHEKDNYATIEPVKSKRSKREVPLQPATEVLLKSLNPDRNKKGLIYKTTTGTICTADNFDKKHFKPIVDKLDIGINRTHSLRKWFGSYQISNGIDVATVCDWMGQEDLNTFYKHYRKEIKEMQEKNRENYALISQVAL
jgi:integrase